MRPPRAPRTSPGSSLADELTWFVTRVERDVVPRVAEMRWRYQREYLTIWGRFIDDRAGGRLSSDRDRSRALIADADLILSGIAEELDRRYLLHMLRLLPLPTLLHITGAMRVAQVLPLLRTATIAAWRHGRTEASFWSDEPGPFGMDVTPDEDTYLARALPEMLARYLAAAQARNQGARMARVVRTGAKLATPAPLPDDAWKAFDLTPNPDLIRLPRPEVARDREVVRAHLVNEERSRRDPRVDEAGRLRLETRRGPRPGIDVPLEPGDPTRDELGWWALGVPTEGDEVGAVSVRYPGAGVTVSTRSFLPYPLDVSDDLAVLADFADAFPLAFGVEFGDFRAFVGALTELVADATAYDGLMGGHDHDRGWCFRSTGPSDPAGTRGQRHLFFGAGLVRLSTGAFLDGLGRGLEARGVRGAESVARRLWGTFAQSGEVEAPMRPAGWFTDDDHVVIDLVLLQDFLEACLRAVTTMPGLADRRDRARFRDATRKRLLGRLGLTPADLVFPWDEEISPDGEPIGALDLVLTWRDHLVTVDMGHWARRPEYYVSGGGPFRQRSTELVSAFIHEIEPRSQALLRRLNAERRAGLSGVVSFTVVPSVELLSHEFPLLWYDEVPRVVTVDELVSILGSDATMTQVVLWERE